MKQLSTYLKSRVMVTTSLALVAVLPWQSMAVSEDIQQLKQEAIGIVKQFGGTLKPALKKALAKGGPSHAVEVCASTAPRIAKELSEKTGWQVKRVSQKARNNKTALPNSWELQVLQQFNQRQQGGEQAKKMAKAEIVANEFRFMKAQGVAPLCLTCHGKNISAEAKIALENYYPNDQATGYSQGEIRGAFSLSKKL